VGKQKSFNITSGNSRFCDYYKPSPKC